MQKSLLFILILLVVIFAGEGLFLAWSRLQAPPATPSKQNNIIEPQPTLTTQPLPSPEAPSTTSSAIDSQMIFALQHLKKGVVVSSIVTNEFRGTITDLNYGGGSIGSSDFQDAFRMRLQADNNESNAFLFSKKELENLRVTQIINCIRQQVRLSFDQIRILA